MHAVLSVGESHATGTREQQVDIKTFMSHETFSVHVITALVAESKRMTRKVFTYPPELVIQQLRLAVEPIFPSAIKIGAMSSCDTLLSIARTSQWIALQHLPTVLDLDANGSTKSKLYRALKTYIIPFATLVTLSVPRAEKILGFKIVSISAMKASFKLLGINSCSLLLHSSGSLLITVRDVFQELTVSPDASIHWSEGCGPILAAILHRRCIIDLDQQVEVDMLYHTQNKPGFLFLVRPWSGSFGGAEANCALTAAIACRLAQKNDVHTSVVSATEYVYGLINSTPTPISAQRLDYNYRTMRRAVPRANKTNPYPFTAALIQGCQALWDRYVEHPFVKEIGRGTIPQRQFIFYLKQDYLFCKHDARANGLLAFKSQSTMATRSAAQMAIQVVSDMQLHKDFFAEYGVPLPEVEATPEEPELIAFTRYIFDIGLRGDAFLLGLVIIPCIIGYGEIGMVLKEKGEFEDQEDKKLTDREGLIRLSGNPYRRWIEGFASLELKNMIKGCLDFIEHENILDPISPARFDQLTAVWARVLQLEIGFWDMAMRGRPAYTPPSSSKPGIPVAKL